MADLFMKDMEPKRPTMLMHTWFNFYGTVVAILDLTLIFMAFEIILLSVVNDFNSDIRNDVSYYYHYGLIYAGFILFIAAFIGLLGFLSESLPKLSLSWALMLFVILSLFQSALVSLIYKDDLSLLINSEAEIAFEYYSFNKSDPKYKNKTERIMKKFQCCGWKQIEEVATNGTLPCHCCRPNDKDLKPKNEICKQLLAEKNVTNEYVCSIASKRAKNGVCEPIVQRSFESDLTWILVFVLITIFVCILSTILTFIISNDLLKVHQD